MRIPIAGAKYSECTIHDRRLVHADGEWDARTEGPAPDDRREGEHGPKQHARDAVRGRMGGGRSKGGSVARHDGRRA